jgi:hypothetical protein
MRRIRSQWPRRRAADQDDELAYDHLPKTVLKTVEVEVE